MLFQGHLGPHRTYFYTYACCSKNWLQLYLLCLDAEMLQNEKGFYEVLVAQDPRTSKESNRQTCFCFVSKGQVFRT